MDCLVRRILVPHFTLFFVLRAPQMRLGKAQRYSLAKRCNAAWAHLGGSENEK